MAAYNTKTPTMDFSSWLRRDFSNANRGGALADALTGFAETADAYGENADKEIMSKFTNETDASKVDPSVFYNPLNALNATKVINENKDRIYKDDQIARAGELNARADADYAIGVFNKEASNDARTMNKADFDAKYNNAGGLDYGIMDNIFNAKEDRTSAKEDRNIKNNLTNLQIQETKNDINYKNSENAYKKQTREQENIDNKFLTDYNNGTITKDTLNQFGAKVSPKVYRAVIDEMNVNEITSKYPDFATFKASEDWKNPNYTYSVKENIYKSFGNDKAGKDMSFNDQIKFQEIDYNKRDLPRVMEEYKKAYNADMPISEQSKFVYKGELPEKLKEKSANSFNDQIKQEQIDNNKKDLPRIIEEYKKIYNADMPISEQSNFIYKSELPDKLKPVEKKALPAKEAGEFQALDKYESVLNELEKAYDSSYVGGMDSSLNTVSPNWVLSDGHRKFNNLMNDVLLGKTSALTGTLSDRDMALLQSSGLSEALGEKDFLEKLKQTKEQVRQMKAKNYDVLNSQYNLPETFNQISNNKENKKVEDTPKINSIRKNNDTNIPEIIKELKNPTTGEVKKWSNIRGFINE